MLVIIDSLQTTNEKLTMYSRFKKDIIDTESLEKKIHKQDQEQKQKKQQPAKHFYDYESKPVTKSSPVSRNTEYSNKRIIRRIGCFLL